MSLVFSLGLAYQRPAGAPATIPHAAPTLGAPVGVEVAAMAYEGVTYVFTPPVFDGTGVTVSRRLTLGGVEVTGAMTGDTYVAPRSATLSQDLVMTYTGSNGVAPDATSVISRSVPRAAHVIVGLGQSNIAYALNNGNPYTNPTLLANIPITTVNARYIGRGSGGTVQDVEITQANVTARLVNVAVAQASQFLDFLHPGKTFIFVDAAESGTGRTSFGDDSNPDRNWSTTETVVNHAQETYGPADLVVEWWYANDASAIANFTANFAPLYLGQRGDGSAFALGDMVGANRVDHCLWDVEAPTLADKGRGLFARTTKWTYIENHHKDSTLDRAAGIAAFHSDPRLAAFAAPRGTWGGHYANDDAHALLDDADGQVHFFWPVVTAVARLAGSTIHEPEYSGHEIAPDGSHAEILVDLPNGGTLSTIRMVEGRAAAAAPLPWQQPVTGMEIERIGSGLPKAPLSRLTETAAQPDARFRGTVTITDTGSGTPRRGRIRITPEVPFVNGDKVYPMWLKNQSPYPQTHNPTAFPGNLSKPWLDFPLEHVPALVDPAATYKFPGVPIRPWGAAQTISGVLATPFIFTPRSVVTGGTAYLSKSPLDATVFAGAEGMLSVWFRCTDAVWPGTARSLFQMRDSGGAVNAGLTTASSGRLQGNMSGTGIASPGTGAFTAGVWQHAMLSWKTGPGGWAQYCVNGAAPINGTVQADSSGLSIRNNGISRASVGSQTTGGSIWPGEIGHFYLNLTQALDLAVPANRQKFINGKNPVSLGLNGEVPTGAIPTFYFDGAGAAWNNFGSGPGLTMTGTLAAGTAPALP